MKNFVNLTPHPLRLRADASDQEAVARDSDIVVAPDPRGPARVSATDGELFAEANGIELYGSTVFGEVTGLPDPEPNTIYIVSALVGGIVTDRDDVFVPGTGPNDATIRDAAGHIYAVTRLKKAC